MPKELIEGTGTYTANIKKEKIATILERIFRNCEHVYIRTTEEIPNWFSKEYKQIKEGWALKEHFPTPPQKEELTKMFEKVLSFLKEDFQINAFDKAKFKEIIVSISLERKCFIAVGHKRSYGFVLNITN